jgi:4-hydroxy-4-methyl-2-oxoglutarate aldolase
MNNTLENADLTEPLALCATSPLYDVLRGMGHGDCVLPPTIKALASRWKLAGRVFTLQGAVDTNLDRHRSLLAWTQFLSRAPADTVVVCQPNTQAIALMGELSANALKKKGVRGYVVDGGCRDVEMIQGADFPVWCSFNTPADIVARWAPTELGGPVTIGAVTIETGDYLLADQDGVVIVPQALAAEAIAETVRVMQTESDMRSAILDGMDPEQAYLKFGKF